MTWLVTSSGLVSPRWRRVASMGEGRHAARLFGAAEGRLRREGFSVNAVMQLSPEGGAPAAQTQLGQDAFTQAWSEGEAIKVATVYVCAVDDGG